MKSAARVAGFLFAGFLVFRFGRAGILANVLWLLFSYQT